MTDGPFTPKFFYGTAWKEERTEQLTYQALKNGFRAIDTANQRKHYFEEAVGLGIQKFLSENAIKRNDLFIQTKYTYPRGQDHRKPYDENAAFKIQVVQSFESSLKHLGLDYIDSLVLHGPYSSRGIHEYDLEVWASMEELQRAGKVKFLGVSNIERAQLSALFDKVTIKPTFVQNRCYAALGWDRDIRKICTEKEVLYQGFSLLTANQDELMTPFISTLVKKYQKNIPQIVFRFAQQMKMIPLTGTSDQAHMKLDLAIEDFQLTEEELKKLENVAV